MVKFTQTISIVLFAAAPWSNDAFMLPAQANKLARRQMWSPLLSTAAPQAPTGTVIGSDNTPTAWDCDKDANCAEVPACDEQACRTSLDVRIHGKWYDLSGWRKAHPAGGHWIDWFDGRDATEVMDAFHSEKGRKMYQRLPGSKLETVEQLEAVVTPDSATQLAFRQLREDLETEGWWKRDMVHEATQLGIFASLVVGAAVTAHSIPVLASALLGFAMTNAGWLGHDYVHGVDKFSDRLRNFVVLAAGLGRTWWSDKHNKHHALTNEQGVDEDIATDPFLYAWAPDPSQDSPLRKIQHLIFFVPFSFLFALWRYDTIKVAIDAVEQKRPAAKTELYCLLAHYAFLFTVFPISVWVPAVFMSGLMSALIVTPTHQSEEMFGEYQADWVTAQFLSTRNAVTNNPFSEWLWGGMQYQLEHHLFPSMPRNNYPLLRKRLQTFAADNNIPGGYRESGEFEILKMNWQLYKEVAEADPVPGAPPTRGRIGQLGAIRESSSPAASHEAVVR
jgi:fatty acid desaturase